MARRLFWMLLDASANKNNFNLPLAVPVNLNFCTGRVGAASATY